MKKVLTVAAGILCGAAQAGNSGSFDQLVLARQALTPAAGEIRQVLPEQPEIVPGGSPLVLDPNVALDEAIVGAAAKFIPIAPGEFDMGSPFKEKGRDCDEELHHVKLTKGFEMQATEVTQLQYLLVTGSNPSLLNEKKFCPGTFRPMFGLGLCMNYPVDSVSWDEAQKFIELLNQAQDKYTYRLPTEAEWEYAARAGMPSSFPYSFGANDTGLLESYGWNKKDGNIAHEVASKKPNRWGLYDMHGNVREWVQDWYGLYPDGPVTDPVGPDWGYDRVTRGGSWKTPPESLRSAWRHDVDSSNWRHIDLGFRLVRSSR